MANPNVPANINQPNVQNVPNVQNMSNAPNVTGPNVSIPNVSVPNVSGPAQLQGAGQMNTMNQINPMINMQHMARGQSTNVLFQCSNFIIPNDVFQIET